MQEQDTWHPERSYLARHFRALVGEGSIEFIDACSPRDTFRYRVPAELWTRFTTLVDTGWSCDLRVEAKDRAIIQICTTTMNTCPRRFYYFQVVYSRDEERILRVDDLSEETARAFSARIDRHYVSGSPW